MKKIMILMLILSLNSFAKSVDIMSIDKKGNLVFSWVGNTKYKYIDIIGSNFKSIKEINLDIDKIKYIEEKDISEYEYKIEDYKDFLNYIDNYNTIRYISDNSIVEKMLFPKDIESVIKKIKRGIK